MTVLSSLHCQVFFFFPGAQLVHKLYALTSIYGISVRVAWQLKTMLASIRLAEESRSKTLNPYQPQGCCSAADPAL